MRISNRLETFSCHVTMKKFLIVQNNGEEKVSRTNSLPDLPTDFAPTTATLIEF